MLHIKKYLTEGLIQFTILLSLIGVRVDVDTYFNGYLSPLLETNIGPSSAYIQTHFHNLRDTLDGYSLHPKCPDLDYYFASRRLLHEVRALGSPRFPTRLSAWLVHLVPAGAESGAAGQNSTGAALSDNVTDGENGTQTDAEEEDNCTFYRRRLLEDGSQSSDPENDTRPCPSEAGKEDTETLGALLWRRGQDDPPAVEGGVTDAPLGLDCSLTLDPEGLHGDGVPLLGELPSGLEPQAFPGRDVDQQWQDFLSLSGFDDLDVDISSAISQDVSLQDAMVAGGGASGAEPHSGAGGGARRVFRLESSDSSHSYGTPGGSGFLDEAVFEQINLLGLEGVAELEGVASLEGRDSDSGLSLGSDSRSPASPDPSEVSLGQSGHEGAAGWSSDAMATDAMATDAWSPLARAESVQHNHTYPALPLAYLREVKEEVLSEEEEEEEEEEGEVSRDERRARALCIPVSVREIVGMPVEDFLQLLGGRGLTEPQVTLLRDIRRRGKNKLAARNCRRRKLEAIGRLEGEVGRLERQREGLLRERAQTARARTGLLQRLGLLTQRILAQLRLSPAHHALHCSPDGQVSVLPRGHAHAPRRDRRKKDRKR
ncbi:nuclear factor erythroid 2-related factor 3 [Anguilla rostrata]|uniref:nuclear factor erythroid 2-related factor 3 n=1 Tax=Anguilla rostrata TaxID=7938 RepID=UPI0030CAA215